jgi:hypothetical protein
LTLMSRHDIVTESDICNLPSPPERAIKFDEKRRDLPVTIGDIILDCSNWACEVMTFSRSQPRSSVFLAACMSSLIFSHRSGGWPRATRRKPDFLDKTEDASARAGTGPRRVGRRLPPKLVGCGAFTAAFMIASSQASRRSTSPMLLHLTSVVREKLTTLMLLIRSPIIIHPRHAGFARRQCHATRVAI